MSDIAGMLELSGQKYFKTNINMLRALMKKVDNMQKWMDNVSKEMDIPGNKNKKEMLEIKKHCNRNEEYL